MAIQPTQPQGVGGVLDTSFQLYKASLGRVWPICLVMSIVASVPSVYMLKSTAGSGLAQSAAQMMAVFADPVYWLVYAVSMALTLWAMGALYLQEYAVGTGAEMGVGAAIQAAFSRLPAMVGAMFLLGLALTLGFVLLVVPSVILMVSLMLTINLVLFENKGPVDALTGSHKLVWGNWWRAAAILTVGGILTMVIYMAVAVIIGIATPFIGLGMEDIPMYSMISGLLVAVLMYILVMPFFAALMIALYWDLKLRKEGGDLAARVGALNAA